MSERKEIKFKRALILGNFYNKKVRIVRNVRDNYEVLIDKIVGLQNNYAVTTENGLIDRKNIQVIYQL